MMNCVGILHLLNKLSDFTKMRQLLKKTLQGALLTGVALSSQAHVGNIQLTDGSPLTASGFTNYGWLAGTDAWLGDSHNLDGANFFNFTLPQAEYVNVSFTSVSAGFDPAFSLYSGTLPDLSHDDADNDPLGNGAVSPSDSAPYDPGIAEFKLNYSTGAYDANTDWNKTFSTIVDASSSYIDNNLTYLAANYPNETPAQWYAANYTPHNGYRDLLNYTGTGGMAANGNPANLYQGQFDALGNWSMGNADGGWGQINYIAHAYNIITPLNANGLPNSPSSTNSYHTGAEILNNLFLQPGSYTIAAGGAGCDIITGQVGVPLACSSPSYSGKLLYTTSLTPSPVPLPAVVWLFLTGLIGVLGLNCHKNKSMS